MRKVRFMRRINYHLIFCLFLLSGCSTERPSNLDAKVSPDGLAVAMVRYRSSGAEMQIAELDRMPLQWRQIDIPALTQSFNFGNRNDELLITYGMNHKDKPYTIHLASISLTSTNHQLKNYSSSDVFLAFPSQLEDGSILVLSGLYRTESGRVPEKVWQIVKAELPNRTINDPFVGYGGYVSIIGTGFFAVEPTYNPPGHQLHLWSLPGGVAPRISHHLTPLTDDLQCTRQGDFCLRSQRKSIERQFISELVALANGKECYLSGLPNRIDRISVAANARVAAVVVAEEGNASRKLRVLKFAVDSCEVTESIQVEWEAVDLVGSN